MKKKTAEPSLGSAVAARQRSGGLHPGLAGPGCVAGAPFAAGRAAARLLWADPAKKPGGQSGNGLRFQTGVQTGVWAKSHPRNQLKYQ